MATEASGLSLGHAVVLLGAAVIAVPLFRRLQLGSVLGYLAAGLVIGPFGLAFISEPETILHVAELGVVMFLFIIGLEMRPAKLWNLRREIFGLGAAQVVICAALLSGLGVLAGLPLVPAVIGASGFVLSSTAVIMKMLDERGQTASPAGQRAVSILLLEDLAVVPLLALVAVLASVSGQSVEASRPIWLSILMAIGTLAALLAAGRWLLNPFFGLLARTGAREIMTAAALLVVLGSAVFLDWGGLSMAMGAFLAGVLLSESTFRHQLEADIEPFRGILLGLFFISVGMSLNLAVVTESWMLIAGGVVAFMGIKAAGIYGIARLFRASPRESIERAALFAQGGEFAFVLYGAALAGGVIDARTSAIMTAIVILSMALTPVVIIVLDRLTPRLKLSMDGVEEANGLRGQILLIGFGRFSQVVSQPLLARGFEIALIENDVEMIQASANFGFKVYYGDGARLDVLRASGAETAEAIMVGVDKPEVADHIVELVKSEFPHAKLFVRAYDRGHSMRLTQAGVDFQIRETFESALTMGERLLLDLGVEPEDAAETMAEVRRSDEERFEAQLVGGIEAGRGMMRGNMVTPQPTPFSKPRREAQAINPEAAGLIAEKAANRETEPTA
ncbi:monovalent cation:proton antiporter-2 (CPA2) family protein [Phenylobacterium sp.]|uniref:monovalent cation:proton antiporter-2 (CPA2) family protein n=1 Tax=Phenylobacterium sp. TaxID=1871053 RepID=UPI00272F8B80|nr:monovalent cation:proton antiporter-2 (CPA2) family protein [Phenylobacterium sp.]MDP1617977.1 monovalent cation:proton antiporter-2 (CPA2) family protein [Phenylobacterium sp.]MDP1988804.1 monovalent cation:proton antiporter-2 (CPA2) family protein [Phenylobacterium sp.]